MLCYIEMMLVQSNLMQVGAVFPDGSSICHPGVTFFGCRRWRLVVVAAQAQRSVTSSVRLSEVTSIGLAINHASYHMVVIDLRFGHVSTFSRILPSNAAVQNSTYETCTTSSLT